MTEPWSFEICQDCGLDNIVGFMVTDEIWAAVMGERDSLGVFCIRCFDKRATEKGIAWDTQPVNWWPVSTVSNALWGSQKQYTMQEQIADLEQRLQQAEQERDGARRQVELLKSKAFNPRPGAAYWESKVESAEARITEVEQEREAVAVAHTQIIMALEAQLATARNALDQLGG